MSKKSFSSKKTSSKKTKPSLRKSASPLRRSGKRKKKREHKKEMWEFSQDPTADVGEAQTPTVADERDRLVASAPAQLPGSHAVTPLLRDSVASTDVSCSYAALFRGLVNAYRLTSEECFSDEPIYAIEEETQDVIDSGLEVDEDASESSISYSFHEILSTQNSSEDIEEDTPPGTVIDEVSPARDDCASEIKQILWQKGGVIGTGSFGKVAKVSMHG